MRYPKVESVTPIMDLADMLRRGVLFSEAHIRTPKKEAPKMSTPKQKYANAGLGQSRIIDNSNNAGNVNYANNQTQGQSSPVPAWLLSSPLIPSINTSVTKM